VEQLELQRLLWAHVGPGPRSVADLDGDLRAQVGRDERLFDLFPGLVIGLARAKQAAYALGEAHARRLQRVLQQDALGRRSAALGGRHEAA
jgi:hypothetical protein